MFTNEKQDDLRINHKKFVKVYYVYNPKEHPKEPYRLFESESFLSGWHMVGDYKTLDEAQESGRSRAKKVLDMGLFEGNYRKGMMSWWDEPKPAPKVIPEIAVLPPSNEVEYDQWVRKVSKSSSSSSSRSSSRSSVKTAKSESGGEQFLEMEEETALKRNTRTEFRK